MGKRWKGLEAMRGSLGLVGWGVDTWAPGDGVRRYRFAPLGPGGLTRDYFALDGEFTALGFHEAETFAAGLLAGVHHARA
jgi:hypothetical protein